MRVEFPVARVKAIHFPSGDQSGSVHWVLHQWPAGSFPLHWQKPCKGRRPPSVEGKADPRSIGGPAGTPPTPWSGSTSASGTIHFPTTNPDCRSCSGSSPPDCHPAYRGTGTHPDEHPSSPFPVGDPADKSPVEPHDGGVKQLRCREQQGPAAMVLSPVSDPHWPRRNPKPKSKSSPVGWRSRKTIGYWQCQGVGATS